MCNLPADKIFIAAYQLYPVQTYIWLGCTEMCISNHLLKYCNVPVSYHVSVVGRAGTLLGDAHTETRQAAIFVTWAKVESSRLTGGAVWAFNIHLQHSVILVR